MPATAALRQNPHNNLEYSKFGVRLVSDDAYQAACEMIGRHIPLDLFRQKICPTFGEAASDLLTRQTAVVIRDVINNYPGGRIFAMARVFPAVTQPVMKMASDSPNAAGDDLVALVGEALVALNKAGQKMRQSLESEVALSTPHLPLGTSYLQHALECDL